MKLRRFVDVIRKDDIVDDEREIACIVFQKPYRTGVGFHGRLESQEWQQGVIRFVDGSEVEFAVMNLISERSYDND